jgi:hypothetical protein
MDTGENQQALRSLIDLVRKGSLVLLVLHYYVFCYAAFEQWGLTTRIVKDILINFGRTGLFNNLQVSKIFALCLLLVSLGGEKGKKDEKIREYSTKCVSLKFS